MVDVGDEINNKRNQGRTQIQRRNFLTLRPTNILLHSIQIFYGIQNVRFKL